MTLRLIPHLLGVLRRLPYIVNIADVITLGRSTLDLIGFGFRLARFLPGILSGPLSVILSVAAQCVC